MKIRLMTIILAISMVFNAMTVTSVLATDNILVSNEEQLREAIRRSNQVPEVTILLSEDIVLTSNLNIGANTNIHLASAGTNMRSIEGSIVVQRNASMSIDNIRGEALGNSGTLTMYGGYFSGVTNNRTFTMNGGTISGNERYGVRNAGGSSGTPVNEMGTFVMNGGTISDNGISGVYNFGTFIMNNGMISNNLGFDGPGIGTLGGGVRNRGIFTMYGGNISNNDATGGGGVSTSVVRFRNEHVTDSGTFTMNGGEITGNRSTSVSGGGGVYVGVDANFIMNGGSIRGNANGSRGDGWNVHMRGDTVIGFADTSTPFGYGAGVSNRGTFIMNAGTISENLSHRFGGGVHNLGSFTLNNGYITANQANWGAGVYNEAFVDGEGLFFMNGGNISDNHTHNREMMLSRPMYLRGDGGGVFNFGTFTMRDGAIHNNFSAGYGGGVYNAPIRTRDDGGFIVSTFNLYGGRVFDNTDGNVFVGERSIFNVNNSYGEQLSAHPSDEVTVVVEGQRINFPDQNPIIVSDRVLIPVRGVFESLGFDVGWNDNTQTVTLSGNNQVVVIPIGSTTFTTNNVNRALDVPAQIINGRTMLPIRFISESAGYVVEWDGATRTVSIN